MIIGQMTSLEFRREKKVWKFPVERFVEYEPSDEVWCRYLGWGHEVTETVVTVIPNAIVTGMNRETGQVTFRALATNTEPRQP